MAELLENTDRGVYCPLGDFYIDPWRPVARAVITHAHSDHARAGCAAYLTADAGRDILRYRLGEAPIESLPYEATKEINGVRLSLHPAGHILGSAQVRLEHQGRVAVVTGDYKTATGDVTCPPFEPLRCHLLVSECTFGLPIYHWRPQPEIVADIHSWWRQSQEQRRTCILYAYSLGKAQRILAALDATIGPILMHGAVAALLPAYRAARVALPEVQHAGLAQAKASRGRALVLAPPGAGQPAWLRKFGPVNQALASGWMQIRGVRRRKALDRGFALSDHADWAGLNWAIEASQAEEVWLTHGATGPMVRWLALRGLPARAIPTPFVGEADEQVAADDDEIATQSNSAAAEQED